MIMPTGFDDDTYGYAYAPPGHLPGEPEVPMPTGTPGPETPANQRFTLPSGVVGYRETIGHHDRLQQLDRQAKAAKDAAEQAARDAQMFGMMVRVARSTKDIEIAKRSIDVMGLQNDIQRGVPVHEAVARHPMALGGGYGSALKAVTPPPTFNPRQTTVGGTKMVETAPNRFQQVRDQPPSLAMPTAMDVDGVKMVQTAPNHFQQVREPAVGKLREIDKLKLTQKYKQRAKLEEEMTGPGWTAQLQAGGAFEKITGDKIAKAKQLDAEIAALEAGAGTAVAAPAKPVGVLGQGTKTDPARPTTPEQFDSVPSKAWFINPKDGKLYQKK